MILDTQPLPEMNKNRHPYELWYEKTGLIAKLGSKTANPAAKVFWYPQLVVFNFSFSGDPLKELYKLITILLEVAESDDIQILEHDLFHFAYLLKQQHYRHSELIIFTRAGFDRDKHLPLNDLAWVEANIVRSGAPILRTANASVISRDSILATIEALFDATTKSAALEDNRPVVGVVIDHAVGFANDVFCKPGDGTERKSRFRHFWLQEDSGGDGTIGIGREIAQSQIDAELAGHAAKPARSEAEIYTLLGSGSLAVPELAGHGAGVLAAASHGTGTAHVAFGRTSEDPGWDFDLLGIQLPSLSVSLTNGLLHDLYVKSALNWAIWHSFDPQEGITARLFVNHSFGRFSGRHDGYGLLESDFERRLATRDLAMVTAAAGNGFQSATHAAVSRPQIEDQKFDTDLTLVVQPDNRAVTFVQIWADTLDLVNPVFPADFILTAPDGTTRSFVSLQTGTVTYTHTAAGDLETGVYCQLDDPTLVGRGTVPGRRVVTLAIAATAQADGSPGTGQAGDWKLSLTRADMMPPMGWLTLWVERGDTPDGFPKVGRQSYLTHPDYCRWDRLGTYPKTDSDASPIKRFGTIAASATAGKLTVVAAFREGDQEMSDISAASSPLTASINGTPVQPTLATAAEASVTRRDMLTTGTFSGSTRPMRGTSFSAPLAMRQAIGNALSGRPAADPKAALVARIPAHRGGPSHDPYRAGHGLLPGGFRSTPPRRSGH